VATTDRAFTGVTSSGAIAKFLRVEIMPLLFHLFFRFKAARRFLFRMSPQAKVRRKASAKSGERIPRFFMSALLSTIIFPVEVKV